MFGYVLPQKGELLVREYEVFKAYYCSLCTEIGKSSQVSRLGLTYDMTFLALLLSSVYNKNEAAVKTFCPFKMKKKMMIRSNPYISYAAQMNILLLSRKLLDDYADSKNIIYLAGAKLTGKGISDAYRIDKLKFIDERLMALSRLEREKCSSIDLVSEEFAQLTSEVFCMKEDENSSILKTMGYNLGKWIYLIDALDDMEKDIKSGNYNPLIFAFDYKGEDVKTFREKIKDNLSFTLISCLSRLAEAFEKLSIYKNKGILENIIYMGLENKTVQLCEGRCCNEKSIRGSWRKGICLYGGDKESL